MFGYSTRNWTNSKLGAQINFANLNLPFKIDFRKLQIVLHHHMPGGGGGVSGDVCVFCLQASLCYVDVLLVLI